MTEHEDLEQGIFYFQIYMPMFFCIHVKFRGVDHERKLPLG